VYGVPIMDEKLDTAGVDVLDYDGPAKPKTYHAGTLSYTGPKLAMLCCWLLWGDVCFTLMETIAPSIMPLRFESLDAPNWVIGMIMGTIPGLITTVCNPVISVKSDRCRSRWGRRIPFILLTLPLLVACLIGVAFSSRIGFWVHEQYGASLSRWSPNTVALVVVGVFWTLFSFFNTFVNSVFWYLFNDVVPETLLARFMSWFRVVGLASGSLYSWFVFQYAGTHSTAILVGVGCLYFFGFGLMCLNVKEGQYPPPPEYVDGEVGLVAAIKSYVKECMFLPHYWYLFCASMGMAAMYAGGMFWFYYQEHTGLTLAMIGKLNAIGGVVGVPAILFSGWLADRYHPIRVVLAGLALWVLVVGPVSCLWLFWHPSPEMSFWLWVAIAVGFAPVGQMVNVMDPPLFMRIFPRSRYGQFCSANAMVRSLAGIAAGTVAGLFLDLLTARWGKEVAYRCLPIWFMGAFAVMFFFLVLLYRSWKRYGGDDAYVPPLPQSGSSEAQVVAETAGR
jgi:Na+/melibiose symporter-like transporter